MHFKIDEIKLEIRTIFITSISGKIVLLYSSIFMLTDGWLYMFDLDAILT